MRLHAIAAVLAIAACSPRDPGPAGSSSSGAPATTGDDSTSTSGSGDDSTSTAAAASTSGSSSTEGPSTGLESTSTTAPAPVCGDGEVNGAEDCDDGIETLLCDDDCTSAACGDAHVNAAAGEQCDDGNVDATDACLPTCAPASCGDGFLQAGVEECDDGNTAPGDGCDVVCGKERWSHVGVAKDVAVADLVKWEPCWSGSYQAGGLVSAVQEACTGAHIMVACRPKGSPTLTLAAHAPRADVFLEPQVDPEAGERHEANGVAWYWSPWYGLAGFGPSGSVTSCFVEGEDEQLCWRVGGNMPLTFNAGYRCGSKASMFWPDASWERIVYQSWD